jgi:anaerobic selenocysteine-containing dehydrogenase
MELNRRAFLKMGLAVGATASLDMKFFRYVGGAIASQQRTGEKVVRSTCSPNCTGACGFDVHVTDGRITTFIQSADYPEEEYNPRGCLRALSLIPVLTGNIGKSGAGIWTPTTVWNECLVDVRRVEA